MQFGALVNLAMDATTLDEVESITTLRNLWPDGSVPNQAIRANELFETLTSLDSCDAAWCCIGFPGRPAELSPVSPHCHRLPSTDNPRCDNCTC
jgi:hypothetical protein